MSKKDCAINRESARIALFLGALAINSLAITPSETQAAPLDYEIGNASVRSCKLVYSDGRPDEPLPSCEGTKDFGCGSGSFTVKMILTNEINQDIESQALAVNLPACSGPPPLPDLPALPAPLTQPDPVLGNYYRAVVVEDTWNVSGAIVSRTLYGRCAPVSRIIRNTAPESRTEYSEASPDILLWRLQSTTGNTAAFSDYGGIRYNFIKKMYYYATQPGIY